MLPGANADSALHALPPELWNTVLSNLGAEPVSLLTFASTSHFASQLARPHLFRELVVSCKHGTRPIEAFTRFLETSPHIASCVRNLTLRWRHPSEPNMRSAGPVGDIDVEELLPILEDLPGLRRLTLMVRICVSRPQLFVSSPVVADLDYLHLDWRNTRAPTSCTPVSLCCVISLFGTIGELFVARLPMKECTCVPALAKQDDYGLWYTDAYFRNMTSVPGHSLAEVKTRIRTLDTRYLIVDSMGGDFMSLLVPQMMQRLACLDALTSITFHCSHPQHVAVYGELLRLCGPNLLHCRVEESHVRFYEVCALVDGVGGPVDWSKLSLSSCTSLRSLELSGQFYCYVDPPNMSVLTIATDVFASAHLSKINHILLEVDLQGDARNTSDFRARIPDPYFAGMDWSSFRQILRKCFYLQTITVKGRDLLESAGFIKATVRNTLFREFVRDGLSEWDELGMLNVVVH